MHIHTYLYILCCTETNSVQKPYAGPYAAHKGPLCGSLMRKPYAGPYAEPYAECLMRSLMRSLMRGLALNLRHTKIRIRLTLPAPGGHEKALMRALMRPLCGPYAGPLGWAGPKGRAHWAPPNGPLSLIHI